jgi:hypothetical protein
MRLQSGASELRIEIDFRSDLTLPIPHAAVTIHLKDGTPVTSTSTHLTGQIADRDAEGRSSATLLFSPCELLQGRYRISVHLLCEQGIHLYESAEAVASIEVIQESAEFGVARIPHQWITDL